MSNTKEHKTWRRIKYRCLNKNSASYPLYGGRGISVCDRWLNSFENFYKDMGPKPGPEYSIDRIDNNGNYCPENCRWATPKKQANNRRTNICYVYRGEKLTMSELSVKYNIKYEVLRDRLIESEWTIEEAIEIPIALGNNKNVRNSRI